MHSSISSLADNNLGAFIENINRPSGELVRIVDQNNINQVPVFTVRIDDLHHPTSELARTKYAEIQGAIAFFERTLKDDNPSVVQSGAEAGRAWLDESPTIKAWKGFMKTAMALYPLQYPTASELLDGTPVDQFARDLFLYGQDAVGIRDRGALFSYLLKRRDGQAEDVLSLACGAAVPESDAIKAMKFKPNTVFVDIDEEALKHAKDVACRAGIPEDKYKIVKADIVRDLVRASESHPDMPEEHFDVVDALGITEYFKNNTVKRLLDKAYGCVKPGGVLIFGNMLDTHPTLRFNQQIVGWPDVIPRSQELLVELASSVAGSENVQIYVPEGGVYAVVELEKPAVLNSNIRSLGFQALA